eukprot:CAMPEP_0185211642 /NCGR_PEP_ID=MMETSP1140-20130426/67125_1 /TAXON_ID=298111 /ORGANISM="Pavlova sp., Strain CCMP459" /LENGTH=177 /DNA_ID=CAMNT_0027779485 /DNA_START=418 /DNA_END=952 /DNA_ORIENTATION=+
MSEATTTHLLFLKYGLDQRNCLDEASVFLFYAWVMGNSILYTGRGGGPAPAGRQDQGRHRNHSQNTARLGRAEPVRRGRRPAPGAAMPMASGAGRVPATARAARAEPEAPASPGAAELEVPERASAKAQAASSVFRGKVLQIELRPVTTNVCYADDHPLSLRWLAEDKCSRGARPRP